MQVQLPDSDRRQVDMAHAALLATTNNFVGNQPNYGFGATYWSYHLRLNLGCDKERTENFTPEE